VTVWTLEEALPCVLGWVWAILDRHW
jgi:hypothetical protein